MKWFIGRSVGAYFLAQPVYAPRLKAFRREMSTIASLSLDENDTFTFIVIGDVLF